MTKLKVVHHTQIRSYHLGHVLRLSWQRIFAETHDGDDFDCSEIEHLLPIKERHCSHFPGLQGLSYQQKQGFISDVDRGVFIVLLNEDPSWWPTKLPFRLDENGKWYYKSRGDSREDSTMNFILHKARFNWPDHSLETHSGGVSELVQHQNVVSDAMLDRAADMVLQAQSAPKSNPAPEPDTAIAMEPGQGHPNEFSFKFTYNDLEETPVCEAEFTVKVGGRTITGKLDKQGCGSVVLPEEGLATIILGNPEEDNEAELDYLYANLEDSLHRMTKDLVDHSAFAQHKKPKPDFNALFEQEVNNYLDDLKQQKEAWQNQDFFVQAWDMSASAATGVGSGIVDYIPDLGEIGEIMDRADIGMDALIRAITTGDVDEMERKFQAWNKRADAGLQEASDSMEMLILILKDERTRNLLAELPAKYVENVPPPILIEMAASQGTQWGIDGAIVSGSTAVGSLAGGVPGPLAGAAAMGAVAARRFGKIAEASAQTINKIGPALKKAVAKAELDLKDGMHHKIDPKREDKSKGDDDKPDEGETFKCDWKGCKGGHKKKIKYPNNGQVQRSSNYESRWVNAGLEPWELYGPGQRVVATLDDYMTDFGKKTDRNITAAVTALNKNHPEYVTQKHHLLPVGRLDKKKNIAENSILIGYDSNHPKNGICLPSFIVDIYRHDLQRHRGGHSKQLYYDVIDRHLNKINLMAPTLCKKDINGTMVSQKELVTKLDGLSKFIEKGIKSWKILLQNNGLETRSQSKLIQARNSQRKVELEVES